MKRFLAAILVLTMLLAAFTGCKKADSYDSKPKKPMALSVVLGVHSNYPAVSLNNKTLNDKISRACESYGEVSTFAVGGEGEAIGVYNLKKSDKDISKGKERQLIEQSRKQILNDVSQYDYASKLKPETDPLDAIQKAGDTLSMSECDDKLLVVYDSGLSTRGLLGSSNVLDAVPKRVTKKLKECYALPNLDGVKVIWIGLGASSGEQNTIPDSYKQKLKMLWTTIINDAGGTVLFDTTVVEGDEIPDLPKVTPIPFPEDVLDFSSTDFAKKTMKLSESELKFKPNSAELIDSQAALKNLEPLAAYLKSSIDNKVIIAGTTASIGGDGIELSRLRANTIKDLLLRNGASDSQIRTVGLGCSNNILHTDDLDSNGKLIEEEASKNRSIYIFAPDSDTAKSLKL